jgi:hypothetical protein
MAKGRNRMESSINRRGDTFSDPLMAGLSGPLAPRQERTCPAAGEDGDLKALSIFFSIKSISKVTDIIKRKNKAEAKESSAGRPIR